MKNLCAYFFFLAVLVLAQSAFSQDVQPLPFEDLEDGAVTPQNTPADPDKEAQAKITQEKVDQIEGNKSATPTQTEEVFEASAPDPVVDVSIPKLETPKNANQSETSPPKALLDPVSEPQATAADESVDLEPEETFARTPLRPPMSDANWRKWAGPALSKLYKIHKKDSLWVISERLFGTPYLWPKVWQLNARITNPNVVEPGTELQFFPGNPGSAPTLAVLKAIDGSVEYLPLLVSQHQTLSTFEQIDLMLRRQAEAQTPPFKTFLVKTPPKRWATVPGSEREGGIFYSIGDEFPTKTDAGIYSVVKVETPKKGGPLGTRIVTWLGKVEVKNGRGTVIRAFGEIQKGNILVTESFELPSISLYETESNDSLFPSAILPIENGAKLMASDNQVLGLVFSSSTAGPRPGAVTKLTGLKGETLGRVLIITREARVATAWVLETSKEIEAR